MYLIKPDDTCILDILIYEKEYKLQSNSYKREKIKFLVNALGYEECCKMIESDDISTYFKIFKACYESDFKAVSVHYNPITGDGYSKEYVDSFMKKVQKTLEIYYVRKFGFTDSYKYRFKYTCYHDIKDYSPRVTNAELKEMEVIELKNKEIITFLEWLKFSKSDEEKYTLENVYNACITYKFNKDMGKYNQSVKNFISRIKKIYKDEEMTVKEKKSAFKHVWTKRKELLPIRKVYTKYELNMNKFNKIMKNFQKINAIYGCNKYRLKA